MAKKLNKNLVIALTGVGFILTTAAGVLMVYSFQEKDPAEFERKAKEYADAKDWNRAALYYRKAYAAGEDTKYLVLAGDMVYESGEELKALSYYQNAINIDPQMLEAQEKTMDLRLEIAQLSPGNTDSWIRLDEVASAILELEGQSEHSEATYAKGLALIRTKDVDARNEADGLEYLKKAVALDPDNVEYVRTLAIYYASLGQDQFDEAVNILADLVDRSTTPGENAAKARCYYATVLITGSEPDYERAIEYFDEAVRLSGDDPDVQSFVQNQIGGFWFNRWANLRNENGPEGADAKAAFEKAESAFRRSMEIEPEGYRSYLQLANLLKYDQQFKEAIEVCEERLSGPENRRGFQAGQTRGARYGLRLELAEIKTVLAGTEPSGSKERKDYLAEAEMEVQDALAEIPTGAEAHYRMGRIRFAEGRFREAITLFEDSDKLTPRTDADTMYFLSHARLKLGHHGAARDAIVKAVSVRNPQPRDWVQYGRILLKLGEPAEAREAVDQVLRKDPDHSDALLVKAGALQELGEDEQAIQMLGGIKSERPIIIAAKAVSKADEGKGEEAISDLLLHLEKEPTNADLVRGLVTVYQKLGRISDANQLLDATVEKVEDPYSFELMRLALEDVSEEEYVRRNRELINATPDEYFRAVRMASLLQSSDPENVQAQIDQYAKAKSLIAAGATEEAKKAGEQGMRAIIGRMFNLALVAQDADLVESLVKEAEEQNADGAGGLSFRGRHLVQQGAAMSQQAREAEDSAKSASLGEAAKGKFDDAIKILQEALELYPSSALTHAALGDAFFSISRHNEAKIAYEHSEEIAPDNPRVVRQLAILSSIMGDDAGLQAWLDKCKKLDPNDPWVKEQLLLRQEGENPEEGIANRTKLAEQDPNDVSNLSALANLYRQIGDAEKCEEIITKMLEVQSDDRTVPFAASVLRSVGKGGAALKVLKSYLRTAPRDLKPKAQLLIAHHYQQLRDFRQAETAFLAAADIDPRVDVCVSIATFYYEMRRYASAKEWYDRGYESAEPGSPQRKEIRRIQIDTLLRLDRVDEAAKLTAAYGDGNPDDPYVIYYESLVAARTGDLDGAIEKLARFIELKPREAAARYWMAQHFASRGDWQQASGVLEDLRAINPKAIQYAPRVLLSQAYAMTGRMELSFQELENLIKEDPDATPIAEELINRLVSVRRYADAEQVITTMINRHPGQTRWLIRNADLAMLQHEAENTPKSQKQHYRSAAIRDLKKAVKMSGYDENATYRLLAVLLNFDAAAEGVKYFEEQVPPNRRTAKMLAVYGRLLARQGNQAAAADAYRFALLRSEFKSMELIFDLIPNIKSSFGNKAAAVLAEKPANAMLARANEHLIALIAMVDGDTAGAIKRYEDLLAAAKTDDEKAAVIFLAGFAHDKSGEGEKAKEAYEKVLVIDGEHEMALNNLAYLLTDKLNKPEEALKYARKAASLDPNANVLDTLGWAYVKAGKLKDGIGRLTQARQLESNNIAITYHLGEAYRMSGEFENAAKLLKEATQSTSTDYAEYKSLAAEALKKAQNRIAD